MKQLPLAIGVEAEPTFANFSPGRNAGALQHLLALDTAAAPLYLWGAPGCGKTHLLRALVRRCAERGGRAGWFEARSPEPWLFDEGWSLVILDGCDELSPAEQQAAFGVFVEATMHAVQIAAAGRVPPVDLPVREDLRSRLGWGLVFALEPLTEAETRTALRRAAEARGMRLSDEVMAYLLSRCARDLKHLMALIARLDGFAIAEHRHVTVPLVKQMLAESLPSPR